MRFMPIRSLTASTTFIWTVVRWDPTVVVLVARPEDRSYLVVVQFQAVADRDFDALDTVLDTFNVIGAV